MKVGSKASVKNSITRSGCQSRSDSSGVGAHHVDVGGAFGVAVAQGSVKSSTTWTSPPTSSARVWAS